MPFNVFNHRSDKPVDSYNVGLLLDRKHTPGEVGLEIEVEGNKFPVPEGRKGAHKPYPMPTIPRWSYVHDGSLRGEDNAEYVLTKPINFRDVPDAVTELFKVLKDFGSVVTDSNRTSVHVHLNCQQFHLNRLTSFMALWFCLEEVLVEWCGDHRVGNLFCLRGKDAPAIITQIKKFLKSDGKVPLKDHLHYAGLNVQALFKFGSLEVRTMRGCTDKEAIIQWVSILQRLYEVSESFQDPRDICSLFSREGPLVFFDNLLGEMSPVVRASIPFDNDRICESMYDGIRLAQDLCYCRDWSMMKPAKVDPDPFGRSARRVLKGLGVNQPAAGLTFDEAMMYTDDFPTGNEDDY